MLEVIKKRRSIRQYRSKEVEEEKLQEILKAAMFSPSAHGTRPWEFIVVKNQETKEKLSQVTPWAGFIKEAPVILVIAASGSRFNWIEDCAIAAENVYLEATNQGLGTCFIQIREGTDNAEAYVKKLLHIPNGIRVLCLMPLGYPAEEKEPHTEDEFEKNKLHFEQF